MQQKVQFAPPAINIVQSKPPPTSWVEDNVVKYLQIKSHVTFLTDILTYVHTLQAQQMTQPKVQGFPTLKTSFVPVPEEGSAEEVAQVSILNTAQGWIKTEIAAIERILIELEKSDPEVVPQLKMMLSELRQIAQAFPRLSPQHLQSLNTILTQLNQLVPRLPLSYQRSFWNTQVKMLQTMMTDNETNMHECKEELDAHQAQVRILEETNSLLKELEKSLATQLPGAKELQKLFENVQFLANQFHLGKFDPEVQQGLSALFAQLAQFKTVKGQPLAHLLADALVHTKTTSFLQQNPKASPAEVKAFLKAFLKQSNLQQTSLPFLHKLGDAIEELVGKKDFPTTAGYSGTSFATLDEGGISPREEVLSAILSLYSPDAKDIGELKKTTIKLGGAVHQEMKISQKKIKACQTTLGTLTSHHENFGKAAAFAVGKTYAAGQPPAAGGTTTPTGGDEEALANEFARIILNKFMPAQQDYLEGLALILSLDNMGASFGNDLMNLMSDFASANNNYNFGNSLIPAGNDFVGTQKQAQNKLNNEKTQCSTDITNINNSLNTIQKQIEQIKEKLPPSGKPTPDQTKILQDQLNTLTNLQSNLKTALTQVTNNLAHLEKITIGPAQDPHQPNSDNYYSVYDANGKPFPSTPPPTWQSDIESSESLVINGDAAADPTKKGGLISIGTSVITFQQNYSSQQESQQMQLNMAMTEIQQEWTVVSTALQLLNQMYMSIAQAIYK
jgi:hypothetical protein